MTSKDGLRELLLKAMDRLQQVATTGTLDCEEALNFVERCQDYLDSDEDRDDNDSTPSDPGAAAP